MSECIEWAGAKIKDGYGRRAYKGKNVLVHRLAYCEHHGLSLDDIDGLKVRHTCDNPPCMNPAHLILGTHQDNMRDMHQRGRNAPCDKENNGNAKLSEVQIAEIRSAYIRGSKEYGQIALAKKYNVHQAHISRIILGKAWK